MKVSAAAAARSSDALAVGIASDRVGRKSAPGTAALPWAFLKSQGFTGALGQCAATSGDGGRLVLFVGLGPSAEVSTRTLRSAAAVATRAAGRSKAVTLDLGSVGSVGGAGEVVEVIDAEALGAQAEGAVLGGYRFAGYRSKPSEAVLAEVRVLVPGGKVSAAARAAVAAGVRRAEAVCLARDLVNQPGGMLTAPEFAAAALEAAAVNGVSCSVHDEEALRGFGFGGVLAVNQGSVQPPRFVELAYDPPEAAAVDVLPTVALVGKGITFDSGGLSIKTAEGMGIMKSDMGGGAAVLATLSACRDAGVGIRVRGYIPLTDNMIDGDALRVGDVITHYGGSTTEVLNTDAEGRLILADALAWATEARDGHAVPDAVIDLATLTGACMVALGTSTAGLLANDDELAERIAGAAGEVGEAVWRLPLVDDYRKLLDSKVADRKNIGSRYGGAITAGLFLRDFVPAGVPWAHLDIAGPAYNEGGDEKEVLAGGTGFGVRTLLELLRTWPTET